ncbi:hypothetical protein A3A84_03835 [Candidatus Collierbacteria bacterium RIFCSPLOWO2_01_FULL_50_23]|nr:MAG: hypothetical protein A3A84_03835 [Candidatus Collierbacteria bacterium RIFCSPLOWO2_01_FULL_50_23]
MIFDGKNEAGRIRRELESSGKLNGKSLVIFQTDGSKQESTYIRLKREMGESLGVKVKVEYLFTSEELTRRLGQPIEEDGVLVQLPIIGADKGETGRILGLLPELKDIDGLNQFSKFLPSAVKAVDRVLIYAWVTASLRFINAAVVGAEGMIGSRLSDWLTERALAVERFDLGSDLSKLVNFDVVVSATGQPSLIKAEMVKEGAIVIDLGYPQGDVAFDEVRSKAGLITPVPGGVGPLTVVSLFENLAQA